MNQLSIRLFVFFFLILLAYPGLAQNIDSIKNAIKSQRNDSLRAYQYADLAQAYLYHESMDLDKVNEAAESGMALAVKFKDTLAMTFNMERIGHVLYYRGLYEQCLLLYFQLLRNAEALKRLDIQARGHRMMGWIDLEMNELEDGLAHFMKAKSMLKSVHADSEEIALAYRGVGQLNYELKRYQQAKVYFDSALNEKPGMAIRERAFVMCNVGSLLRSLNHDFAASANILKQAMQLLEDTKSNRDVYAKALAELSLTWQANGQLGDAERLAKKAYLVYSTVPFKRRYIGTYSIIADALTKSKDFENALRVEHEMRVLNDSIFTTRNQTIVADLKTKYEIEKKQSQITLLEQRVRTERLEMENRNWMTMVIALFFVLILIFAAVLFVIRSRFLLKVKEIQAIQKIQAEKERIGRDLHDSLGGQLSSISVGLDRLAKGNLGGLVHPLQEIADKAIAELRDSLWVLDKPSLTIADVEQRINGLFWQYRKMEVPMVLRLQVEESLLGHQLDSDRAGQLFRILQEATHNSVKHSNASQLEIVFKNQGINMLITISDNGIGFEPTAAQQNGHYGVKNMHTRAKQIGADLTILSTPSKGVCISVTLPV
jgi:signal transduction histidine kinase